MAKRVLVVDDQAHVRNILDFNLKRMGYEVTVAADGENAVRMANADRYDVILLDMMLPGMDGDEVLDIFKKTALPTPVIVVSAKGEQESILAALRAGAKDYVVKPFNMEILFQKIAKQVFQGNDAEQSSSVEDTPVLESSHKLSSLSLLVLSGEITETEVKALGDMVESYFKMNQFRFILDMSRITEIKTLAMGQLVKIQQAIDKKGGCLFVYLPQPDLVTQMKESNFYKNFNAFEDPGELLNAI